MSRHETGNLIDLDDEPPASGASTPPFFSSSQTPTDAAAAATTTPKHQQQHHHPPHFQHSYSYPSAQPQSSPPPPPQPQSPSYGIGSAVLGLWRRISTIDTGLPSTAPSPPPPASQLYHAHTTAAAPHGDTSDLVGSGGGGGSHSGDGIHRPFVAPRRTASPRGLPSLEPLVLHGYRADTGADERLLPRAIAEEIRTFLPERLKIMEDWRLVYSLYQNGSSLATLYKLCEEYRGRRVGFVLVVRDGKDGLFGAYLTEAPHPAPSYFGTGECFLWRASMHAPLPPPPSADTTDLNYRSTTIASPTASSFPPSSGSGNNATDLLAPGPTDPTTNKLSSTSASTLPDSKNNNNPQPPATQSVRFQNFAYSGANDYCIFCETKFLSVGGGRGGRFGLWLDDELGRGHSAECDTFANEPLSEEGEKFDVLGVELWVVGAS
ncbi:hypothetical protein F5X96DRAFT_429954 [Biscogniauxia mediterranea]|nr:hypothetical protein F5X96DRAFT_429954 [Biscogniauxia mediterranea]